MPYSSGVGETTLTDSTSPKLSDLAGKTVLAFYSSCKNKPHRFQFIYSPNGYGKNTDGSYKISRKDDRVINQANCQYYVEINNPSSYVDPTMRTGTDNSTKQIKNLGLWLPSGFAIGTRGTRDNQTSDADSYLSSWYRGKRYGFAQQVVYVPVLERYCQKFNGARTLDITNKIKMTGRGGTGTIAGTITYTGKTAAIAGGSKSSDYSGFRFEYDYQLYETYKVEYDLEVTSGSLSRIGGHNAAFATDFEATSTSG
jgi:hypothetical protein